MKRKKIFYLIIMLICTISISFRVKAAINIENIVPKNTLQTNQTKTLPQHSIVEVPEFTGISNERHQFASDLRNGIYYFVDNDLYLYLLENNTSSKIYSFEKTIRSEYFADNKLYVASFNECYVFNLETHQIEQFFTPKESYINAIGADKQGRIYIAGTWENAYYISMYSSDGEYITNMPTDDAVYCFDGFDAATGNIYYETYYNWYYWGYEHPGKSIAAANVSDNAIKAIQVSNNNMSCLEYACQSWYYNHIFNADVIAHNCLITASITFGRVQLIKSQPDGRFEVMKTWSRKGTENTTDDYLDNSSIGVRTIYNKGRDSIIIYENDKVLNEYDMETGEKKGTFTLQHYVYNLCKIGDTIIAIEKEDEKYYIELIDWSDSDKLEIKGNPSMKSGEAQQLQCTTSKVYSEKVKWSSSDNEVAAVSAAGMVSAWHKGTAVITAQTEDETKKAVFTIQVTSDEAASVLDNISLSSGAAISKNISANNYTAWSSPVKSYLYENSDDSLTRVEYVGDKKVVVETYLSGKLTTNKTINTELDIFGGFYHGKDYNYIVYGAFNTDDSDDVEVIRVVKYDKDFNRISSKSISAVNTYIPFDAGSLRMDETAGKLYIYTCHEMYQSSDGYHHQANMTFVLNEETLEIEDSYFDVMNIAQAGYVSHSFNQFIKTDGKYVYRVDHGDANPRAVSITKCDVNGKITSVSYRLLLNINGQHGANATGVSIGGTELSSNNCIVAGNSVDQSDEAAYNSYGVRNIFISVVDKDFNDIQTKWLTDYTEDNKVNVCTPQLVKIDETHFLVMWEECNTETGKVVTKAATIDEDGTMTSSPKMIPARLSDCQPVIAADGKVKWYVTDENLIVFYYLEPFALNQIPNVIYGDANSDGEVDSKDAVLIKKYLAKYSGLSIDKEAADVNGDSEVDSKDAVRLLRHLAGYEVTLGK